MLLPHQVIPFLAHADEILRDQALAYFRDAHDPAPLTADDVWAALDKLESSAPTDNLIRLLPNLPGSDAATHRLIAAVGDDKYLEAEDEILNALEDLDIAQLQRHADAILAVPDLPEDVRDNINERLELAKLGPDELWDRLLRYMDNNKAKYWDELEHGPARRLVKALATHGPSVADRATELAAVANDDSRDVFAIDLLAQLRHRPALDLLVKRFVEADEDDDVLHETLMLAIPRVGGPDAVPLIEPHFANPRDHLTYLIYGAGLLGHIKHPDAEAALVRLLDATPDPDDRTHVALALTDQITTDALPRLREIVLAKEYDERMVDLDRCLVACAMMSAFDFPELGALREEVVAREIERDRRLAAGDFGALGLDDVPDDLNSDDFDDYEDDDEGLPPLPDSLDDRMPAPTATIRNQGPKTGRNDPCPCGSGKKYKKCCGK